MAYRRLSGWRWPPRIWSRHTSSKPLVEVLREDVALRFATVEAVDFSKSLAVAVAGLVEEVAEVRNLARF